MIPIPTGQETAAMALCDTLDVKNRHALVVTSDPAMIKRCRDAAKTHGFAVELADCGVDALNAARRSPPDVVVLDLELRDVHGLELVNWLRSSPVLKLVPIIAATAFGVDVSDPRLGQSGVLTVLRKPLRAVELDRWLLQATE